MYAEGLSDPTEKRAKAAIVAASMALEDSEQVQGLICGEYLGHDAVAVLTDRRVLCINSRFFAPDQDSIALTDLVDVKGWIEGNRATLLVTGGAVDFVIGDINEVETAQQFAGNLRTNL
jgi:hypothetical protein